MGTQTLRTLSQIIEEGIDQVIKKGYIPTKVVLGKGEWAAFQSENRPVRKSESEGPVVQISSVEKSFSVLIVKSENDRELRVEFKDAGSLQV